MTQSVYGRPYVELAKGPQPRWRLYTTVGTVFLILVLVTLICFRGNQQGTGDVGATNLASNGVREHPADEPQWESPVTVARNETSLIAAKIGPSNFEQAFMAMLDEAKRLTKERPERPWKEIQDAIEPFNVRTRKFHEATRRVEENARPAIEEFLKEHQAELESLMEGQTEILFPGTLLEYLSSDEVVGTLKVKDLVTGLMDDPKSFDLLTTRLNLENYGETTPRTKEDLILVLQRLGPEMQAHNSRVNANLPADLRDVFRAQTQEAEAGFLNYVYYRFLTAEYTPWDEKIGDLISRMEKSLSTLPSDSVLKTRLASEFAEFLAQ